jgi:hypothetical protein
MGKANFTFVSKAFFAMLLSLTIGLHVNAQCGDDLPGSLAEAITNESTAFDCDGTYTIQWDAFPIRLQFVKN